METKLVNPLDKRDTQGRFLPGGVPNPYGAPKKEANILHWMRTEMGDRMDEPCSYVPGHTWGSALVQIELEDALEDAHVRKHLLDRLYGKAAKSVRIGGDVEAVQITVVEVGGSAYSTLYLSDGNSAT